MPIPLIRKARRGGRLKKLGWRHAAVLVVTSGMAVLVVQAAAANIFRAVNPDLIERLGSDDLRGRVTATDRAILVERRGPKDSEAALARAALRTAPLDPAALRILAMAAEQAGDRPASLRLLVLAERVSRRDVQTQLRLALAKARQGDPDRVLGHINRSLVTQPQAAPLIFPVLSNALADRQARSAFLKYARTRPPWLDGFLAQSLSTSLDPSIVLQVVTDAGLVRRGLIAPGVSSLLISRLIAEGKPAAALALARGLPSVPDDLGREFDLNLPDYASRVEPFTWVFPGDGNAGARIVGQGQQPQLEIYAAPGIRRVVAQRTFALPAGTYRFSASPANGDALDDGSVKLNLDCAGSGPVQKLWGSPNLVVPARAEFKVPRDCPLQSVSVTAGGDARDLNMVVANLNLHLVRNQAASPPANVRPLASAKALP